ncbi:MAG TPA: S-layer homology domain-containing protein, partial [Thermoanaerobaculia bacterium]|nr:S-layer homology domain-containing protein [Thermoanaerobaculia bacterium]
SGVFTEYPVPTASSGPNGIGVGPDGAVWFTEFTKDKIGRVDGGGAIDEHPIPAGSATMAITAGADGNLWFSEYGKNKIGRLTPSGDHADFPLLTANAYPEGVTLGADGNVWFAENSGAHVGRVTSDGVVTEFALPTTGRVFRIVGGPDGNLWFTEFDNNRIGRMTTAGVLKEYLVTTAASGPYGITAGADRNLWFSEFHKAKLGAVGVGAPALTVTGLTPHSGPAAGGVSTSASTPDASADATVIVGLMPASSVSIAGGSASFVVPALSPGVLYDVVVTDPATAAYGRIDRGWLADFTDVPQAHVFHAFVESLVRASVTAGCGGGDFCPGVSVTRAQMAVFLLKAEHGAAFVPPPATGTVFADVPADSFASAWIEALAAEGITGGCGGGNYCPSSAVRRDQMAVFLLKAEHGSSYVPPACSGVFDDVPCPSAFAAWIERLAAEQVTGGCGGGDYCPQSSVTRGQMAVFLVKTFDLP